MVYEMPIGKDEWKSGNKYLTFEERIKSFLKTNQDSAFTLSEIVTGLGYTIEINDLGSFVSGVAGYWLFQNAIENLVKQGTVEAKEIKQPTGKQIYYRAV
jgi:hypothetical protein